MRAKERAMLSFSWVDATCHQEFTSSFGVDVGRLPTALVVSRSKKRYAELVGDFTDSKSVLSFIRAVKRGSRPTAPLSSFNAPSSDVNCEELHKQKAAELAAVEEDDVDMDDMLADILAEEKREAEEREAKATEELQKKRKSRKEGRS